MQRLRTMPSFFRLCMHDNKAKYFICDIYRAGSNALSLSSSPIDSSQLYIKLRRSFLARLTSMLLIFIPKHHVSFFITSPTFDAFSFALYSTLDDAQLRRWAIAPFSTAHLRVLCISLSRAMAHLKRPIVETLRLDHTPSLSKFKEHD